MRAKTPLLVYDPTGTGQVQSAEQLFGNWTFGASHSFVNKVSLNKGSQAEDEYLWANGYEALAVLDTNSDGEISGEERALLALWFDDNQDGISQKGEVQSLARIIHQRNW
jgi:hypothetical protein